MSDEAEHGPGEGPEDQGWALLDEIWDHGRMDLLPEAIARFDTALADGGTPSAFVGRGVARAYFAGSDPDGRTTDWTAALDDLWTAWRAPATSFDRGYRGEIASHIASASTRRYWSLPSPAALERLAADLRELAEPGSAVPVVVRIARGIADLEREQLGQTLGDHAAAHAALAATLQEAPADTPLLVDALWAFVSPMVQCGDIDAALIAVDRLHAVSDGPDRTPELDALEADLLYMRWLQSADPVLNGTLVDRFDQLLASTDLPPDSVLNCGEMHLDRASEPGQRPRRAEELDIAVRLLERGLPGAEGEQETIGTAFLGAALNRRAALTGDAAERARALGYLDEALRRGLRSHELTLSVHVERLRALSVGVAGSVGPLVVDQAIVAARRDLASCVNAGLRKQAELALELAGVETRRMALRWDDIDPDRLRELYAVAERHPDPPPGWSSAMALFRSRIRVVEDGFRDGVGDFGRSSLLETLQDTSSPAWVGQDLPFLVAYQSLLEYSRTDEGHTLDLASAVFRSASAGPSEHLAAALADLAVCVRQTRGADAVVAALDAALAAAAEIDPGSEDNQWVREIGVPILQAMRAVARPGDPVPNLPPATMEGRFAGWSREAIEIVRAQTTIAAIADPARQRRELATLESRVRALPAGMVRRAVVQIPLILWQQRAERLGSAADVDRAIAWVPEVLDALGGPEHPLFVPNAHRAAAVHRLRGRPDDLRRSRELALVALRGQGWSVLLQSGTEHGVVRARQAAADAVRLARWCIADEAFDDLVAALDAGRGLVLQAAVTSRTIADQLRAAGAAELADEWLAGGGDDRVELDVLPGVDVRGDLRRRVLRALGAAVEEVTDGSVERARRTLVAADAEALVYLVPADGPAPGLAVVIPARAAVEVLELPELDATVAAELARGVAAAGRDIERPRDERWRPGVRELMSWAWRTAGRALAEVADRLRPAPNGSARLVLVPFGPLALVPWHASGDGGTGLLQHAVVSYALSGRLLERAMGRPRHPDGQVVVVGNPTGDLPGAGEEARLLVEVFHRGATYLGTAGPGAPLPSGPGAAAELRAVLDRDAWPVALLHLACHAGADPAAPWRSRLVLADRSVEIVELLGLRRTAPLPVDTVVLAGCHTNVAGVDHDEAFSLASAFLAAGARTVFGSMWAVPDDHTSRLMFMVHHHLAAGRAPSDALHLAQLSAADPERVPPPPMPAALSRPAPGGEDPIAWAGFQHIGV